MSQQRQEDNDQPARLPTSSIAANLQSLRSVVGTPSHLSAHQRVTLETLDRRAALETFEQEMAARRQEAIETARESEINNLVEAHGSTSPSQIARSRRRMFRPLERHDRLQNARERMDRLARSENTDGSGSRTPRLSAPNVRPRSSQQDDQDTQLQRRRSSDRVRKRRKLNDGGSDDEGKPAPQYNNGKPTFNPLPLSMNIVPDVIITDRDMYDEHMKRHITNPNNTEIYRSRKARSTILMKHSGGWPFTLSRIEIKIPTQDYSVSSLQGMVFVCRDGEELLMRATVYDEYWPASYHHHPRHRPGYDSYRPSHEYFRSVRSPRQRPPYSGQSLPESELMGLWVNLSPNGRNREFSTFPSHPGLATTVTLLTEPATDSTLARPWHDADAEYTRRAYYADRHRPGQRPNRDRWEDPSLAQEETEQDTADLAPTSSSDSETDDDQEQEYDRGQVPEQGHGASTNDRSPYTRSELNEAYLANRTSLDAVRTRYLSNPSLPLPDAYSTNRSATLSSQQQQRPPSYTEVPPLTDALNGDTSTSDSGSTTASDTSPQTRVEPRSTPYTTQQSIYNRTLPRPAGMPDLSSSPTAPASTSTRRSTTRPTVSGKRLPGYDAAQKAKLESERAEAEEEDDLPTVHARFLVRRETGGVAITFQPQLSGTYILLKLWTQCPNSTVTVQSIVAYGFGGNVCLPDLSFR